MKKLEIMKIVLAHKESVKNLTEILELGEDDTITLFVHKKALPLVEERLRTHRINITKGEYIYIVGSKRVMLEKIDAYV